MRCWLTIALLVLTVLTCDAFRSEKYPTHCRFIAKQLKMSNVYERIDQILAKIQKDCYNFRNNSQESAAVTQFLALHVIKGLPTIEELFYHSS